MRVKIARFLVFLALVGTAWSVAARPIATAARQSTRQEAPDFRVTRFSDGREVSLYDFRGRIVLVYFFFPS